jgi:hypothetical protein
MNHCSSGLAQSTLDKFIAIADSTSVYRAMDILGVSIPMLAKDRDAMFYLREEMWNEANLTLIRRLVGEYQMTGVSPWPGFAS